MERMLCWLAMGIAGVVLLLFLVDLILRMPFGGLSPVLNIVVILAAGIILYISWETMRELH